MSENGVELLMATVGAVSSSGITLKFDGQDQATTKRYKSNKSITFSAGQRVLVAKVSGTYIVICAVS